MAKKKKPLSPFRNGSEAQIAEAEASSFFLIVGPKVFMYNNQMTFTKIDVEFHFGKVKEFLLEVIEDGTEKEKSEAITTLLTLKIMPLRIN